MQNAVPHWRSRFTSKSAVIQAALVLLGGVVVRAATPDWVRNGEIVRDAAGNVYVVGTVTTDIIPVTPGAFQTKFNGGACGYLQLPHGGGQGPPIPCKHGFAAKISSDGSTVLYATYLQGSQYDLAWPIGVDSSGNLFVRVNTTSTDFPVTGLIAGLPPPIGGGIILELAPDASRLVFSDAFGFPGVPSQGGGGAALMPDGKLVLYGTTDGTVFPTTAGAYLQARPNVSLDGYIVEWDPQTNTIVRSTLIGGSDQDILTNLTMDSAGNVYVAGYTISKDFPVKPGAFYSPGTVEARVNLFVAKLDANLSTLAFSVLFGGSYQPIPNAIALDSAGNVYVGGFGCRDLPVSPGAFETTFSGGFLAKFDGETGARMYLTYLGDGPAGFPGRLAVASDDSVWISGGNQYGGVVTTPDAVEPSLSNINSRPSYLKHISADGSQQLYGTYLGDFLALIAPGVALVSDSTNIYGVHDFNTPSPPLKQPQITSIVNAASMSQPGFIAPGEIVSVFGLSIGPDQPAAYKFDSTGRVSSNLNGLQVLIDGITAPILYASKNQINAVVPFSVQVSSSSDLTAYFGSSIEVRNPGSAAPLVASARTVPSLPGIFASESGAARMLNQDTTMNGVENPAKQGSTVSFFVTGLGPMPPSVQDGGIATRPSSTALPIQVFLGVGPRGPFTQVDAASIKYAGDVPGQIEGLQQINVQLPIGTVFSTLYVKSGASVSNAVAFFEQ